MAKEAEPMVKKKEVEPTLKKKEIEEPKLLLRKPKLIEEKTEKAELNRAFTKIMDRIYKAPPPSERLVLELEVLGEKAKEEKESMAQRFRNIAHKILTAEIPPEGITMKYMIAGLVPQSAEKKPSSEELASTILNAVAKRSSEIGVPAEYILLAMGLADYLEEITVKKTPVGNINFKKNWVEKNPEEMIA